MKNRLRFGLARDRSGVRSGSDWRSFRSGRLLVALAAAAVAVIAVSGAGAEPRHATAPPSAAGELTVAPQDALGVLNAMGISVPAQSCLANVSAAGCPPVTKIIIHPPVNTPGWVSFGPPPPAGTAPPSGIQASGETRSVQSIRSPKHAAEYDGTGCWTTATTPNVYSTASSTAQNVCNESGVSDQETWGQISRWQNNAWATMNDCYTNAPTDGWQSCTSTFDCYHPTVAYRYVGFANAYSVIYGVGYFGSHQSDTDYSVCY